MDSSSKHPAPPVRNTEFILEDARAGNEDAWQELFDRYRPMLLVTIECRMQGMVSRGFDAEDILQDAFRKAWEKQGTFDYRGEGSFRAWLRMIVFREFFNGLKSMGAERKRDDERSSENLEELYARARRPSQILVEIEENSELVRGMAELTEEERELVSLRVFEHKDWKEIGEIMGYSRQTASDHFAQAIKSLTRKLNPK